MVKDLKVVLLGYMASGKSTVGRLLSEKINLPFKDLDAEIERSTKMTVSQIFKEKGELFFRKKEAEILQQLLSIDEGFVLALGGGTPCYGRNIETINISSENTFYLKLNVSSLVQRLVDEKNLRPIVANIPDASLPEFVGKHLFERNQFYALAKHIINCDQKSEKQVTDEIFKNLV